jgi:hypothetical protein
MVRQERKGSRRRALTATGHSEHRRTWPNGSRVASSLGHRGQPSLVRSLWGASGIATFPIDHD